MCMSPHEMTSAQIEEYITAIEGWIANDSVGTYGRIWQGRVDEFKALLKERAENGTYHTAGGGY